MRPGSRWPMLGSALAPRKCAYGLHADAEVLPCCGLAETPTEAQHIPEGVCMEPWCRLSSCNACAGVGEAEDIFKRTVRETDSWVTPRAPFEVRDPIHKMAWF